VSAHDEHSSFIKTPQQLIVVVFLSFVVPIVGIIMLVQLVTGQPTANRDALTPDKVAERIRPVSGIEMGAPAAAPGARSGEAIVKATCTACHGTGVNKAPKIGDKNDWAALIKKGLAALTQAAVKGTDKGMPAKGGDTSLTDAEVTRAVAFMANSAGANFKEPAAAPAAKKKSK
jgi:cytochrome c5